ncbi:MAG: hypothetical protein K0T00_1264 [Gaiellaceae bacterium]|nr:hypothetical protein [Gaiellaceae bacterium]
MYDPAFVSPESQVRELGNSAGFKGARAPPALYFGTSVFPNSITSGPLPEESVASNFVL